MTGGLSLEAPAKLNLGLELLDRRADGFHEIATIYQEIDMADRLVLEPASEITLEVAGLPAPAGEDNLVLRAARALSAAAGVRQGARIRLEKRVPALSGLGGGSSDAAAALVGLDRLWGIGLGYERLLDLAAALGSDVPFFLVGGTALGLGRGEEVCPLPDLPALFAAVVRPEEGLSTAEVFAHAGVSLTGPRNCNSIRRFAQYYLTGRGLEALVRNDLQSAAIELLPGIDGWCNMLIEAGALAASLSGSGSAVFGLFEDRRAAELALERVEGGASAHLCRFRPRSRRGAAQKVKEEVGPAGREG